MLLSTKPHCSVDNRSSRSLLGDNWLRHRSTDLNNMNSSWKGVIKGYAKDIFQLARWQNKTQTPTQMLWGRMLTQKTSTPPHHTECRAERFWVTESRVLYSVGLPNRVRWDQEAERRSRISVRLPNRNKSNLRIAESNKLRRPVVGNGTSSRYPLFKFHSSSFVV